MRALLNMAFAEVLLPFQGSVSYPCPFQPKQVNISPLDLLPLSGYHDPEETKAKIDNKSSLKITEADSSHL